jgi:hypothetical protein
VLNHVDDFTCSQAAAEFAISSYTAAAAALARNHLVGLVRLLVHSPRRAKISVYRPAGAGTVDDFSLHQQPLAPFHRLV